MHMNKIEVAKKLEQTIMSQKDLQNRAEIEDMLWFLTDVPDQYDITKDVAKMISDERLKRGISQVKLAKRSGMSSSRISEFSTGVRVPHLDHLQSIAHGLGMRLVVRFENIEKEKK